MTNTIRVNMAGFVAIGRYLEHLVTAVEFPADRLGDGTGAYTILFQRPGENTPYPVECRNEWPILTWIVHAADTAIPGTGKVEIRWDGPNGEVGKSQIYAVQVNPSLPDPGEAPEAWTGYISQVAGFAEAARDEAKKAQASADAAAETLGQVVQTRDDSRNAATEAARSASSAAGSAQSAAENAAAAERSAELAEQAAAEKGWMCVDAEADGHLYLYTSGNVEEPRLENVDGRLFAIYE